VLQLQKIPLTRTLKVIIQKWTVNRHHDTNINNADTDAYSVIP
jgi:hypothetical protein